MAEEQMLEQWARWLGVNEPKVVKKSLELRRLLDMKSKADISANNKTVICLDIAATLLGANFDSAEALKRIKFRQTDYVRQRRTVEKILDLAKTPSIPELCVQLDLPRSVQAKAEALFESYRRAQFDDQIDFSHPQYTTMSIYQCCKALKVKVSRGNLLRISTLRGVQWTQLEKDWAKWLGGNDVLSTILAKSKTQRTKNDDEEAMPLVSETKSVAAKQEATANAESYEDWRDRMLKKAYAELALLEAEAQTDS